MLRDKKNFEKFKGVCGCNICKSYSNYQCKQALFSFGISIIEHMSLNLITTVGLFLLQKWWHHFYLSTIHFPQLIFYTNN